jgi:hypothetical protein
VFKSDKVTIRNNTVYHNGWELQDHLDPGELTVENGSNNNLYNNSAVSLPDLKRGGSIRIANDNNSTKIKNNIIVGKRMFSAWNTETSIDGTNQKSKIDTLTAFINPSIDPSLANFRLQPTSKAIDKGTNTSMGTYDLDYFLRPANGTVDIGCYEYGSFHVGLPVNRLNSDDFKMDIFPNPAVNHITITIKGEVLTVPRVTIYNLNGQLMKSEMARLAGNQNTLELNVSDIPSGIYLVRLNLAKHTLSGKMIIQK